MQRRPQGPSRTGAKHASRLPKWRPRTPLTITVRYHGGSEAWWCIKARGTEFRVPGHIAIHDVMREIFNNDSMT